MPLFFNEIHGAFSYCFTTLFFTEMCLPILNQKLTEKNFWIFLDTSKLRVSKTTVRKVVVVVLDHHCSQMLSDFVACSS